MKQLISIIAPVFNEQDNLADFYEAVMTMIKDQTAYEFELILVDDGSSDLSWGRINDLAAQDQRIFGIKLSRNFGHQIALAAGYDHARGNAAISLDADLQHPPELIPQMIEKWQSGATIVCARRTDWSDSWLKKSTASLYYWLLHRIAAIPMQRGVGDFRLLDQKAYQHLTNLKDRAIFLRGLVAWLGFHQEFIPYVCPARKNGVSGYTWKKMIRLALDGIFGFSMILLRLPGIMGCLLTVLMFGAAITGFRLSTNLLITCLIAYMTLFAWVTLAYIGRVFEIVRGRPLYAVEETCGKR